MLHNNGTANYIRVLSPTYYIGLLLIISDSYLLYRSLIYYIGVLYYIGLLYRTPTYYIGAPFLTVIYLLYRSPMESYLYIISDSYTYYIGLLLIISDSYLLYQSLIY